LFSQLADNKVNDFSLVIKQHINILKTGANSKKQMSFGTQQSEATQKLLKCFRRSKKIFLLASAQHISGCFWSWTVATIN